MRIWQDGRFLKLPVDIDAEGNFDSFWKDLEFLKNILIRFLNFWNFLKIKKNANLLVLKLLEAIPKAYCYHFNLF